MKRAVLMAVLAAVCSVARAEEDTNLYYKVFYLPHYSCTLGAGDADTNAITVQKTFLTAKRGVSWPEGSDLTYSADSERQLIVRNTLRNLEKIGTLWQRYLGDHRMFVEYQLFAFRRGDIEALYNGTGVSCESLMQLRTKGRAKLVTTASCLTKSGEEAVTRTVEEINYPTELIGELATNQTGQAWTLVPANFEMRETGTLLQVVPEFDLHGENIRVMLTPQWITLNRWETFDAGAGTERQCKKVPLRQPVFSVSSIQTEVTIKSGETVLLGGGQTIDGEWVNYHFLRASVEWAKENK